MPSAGFEYPPMMMAKEADDFDDEAHVVQNMVNDNDNHVVDDSQGATTMAGRPPLYSNQIYSQHRKQPDNPSSISPPGRRRFSSQ